MGEIAEMMLDGTLDCETGEYLGDPCGYPRTNSARVGKTKAQKRNEQRKRAKARKNQETSK